MTKFQKENLDSMLKLLESDKFITRKELSEQLQVSIKTIRIYINILKEFGFEFDNKKGPGGGVYLINKKVR